MTRTTLLIASIGLLLATPSLADFRGEVEAARANARAGGPVSEHDAELLERWGCTSGTRNPVCKSGRYSKRYYKPRRRERLD